MALYESLGRGDIGLIASAYMYVSSHGKAAVGQPGIHTDEMIPGLRRMVEVSKRHGARIMAQIVHCGINSTVLPQLGMETLAMTCLPDVKPPQFDYYLIL